MAWYLSAFVIKKEFERDVNQSLWTHRFFWMFTGVFSVTKMFEDYFLPINIIVNSMFLVSNFVFNCSKLAVVSIRPLSTIGQRDSLNDQVTINTFIREEFLFDFIVERLHSRSVRD